MRKHTSVKYTCTRWAACSERRTKKKELKNESSHCLCNDKRIHVPSRLDSRQRSRQTIFSPAAAPVENVPIDRMRTSGQLRQSPLSALLFRYADLVTARRHSLAKETCGKDLSLPLSYDNGIKAKHAPSRHQHNAAGTMARACPFTRQQ